MQTRRTFLGTSVGAVSGGAALAGGLAAMAPAAATTAVYDFAAIEGRLSLPFTHRQAFGSARLADGIALAFMTNSLNAYEFDYGEGPGTLHALGIFFGTAVALLVDDAGWRKYQIDVVQARRGDPAKRHAESGGNPYLAPLSNLDPTAARTDLHGLYHDTTLAALAKRRASFFACDNALRGLATDIAVTYAFSTDPVPVVHADLRARLFPGALLVPAGVAAVNQAQEMKFTYMPASL
jgi:intracellular sulfur oxidation DsrE/DsrF family protein